MGSHKSVVGTNLTVFFLFPVMMTVRMMKNSQGTILLPPTAVQGVVEEAQIKEGVGSKMSVLPYNKVSGYQVNFCLPYISFFASLNRNPTYNVKMKVFWKKSSSIKTMSISRLRIA